MTRNVSRALIVAFALTASSSTGQTNASADQVGSDYKVALTQLTPHWDGFQVDDPAALPALEQSWSLFAEWLAAYRTQFPLATPDQIATAAKGLNPSIVLDIQPLDASNDIVAIHDGETGTVFILRHNAGGYAVAWELRNAWRDFGLQYPVLRAWSSVSADDGCRARVPENQWTSCGPLFAEIVRLPGDAHGNARFAVSGEYAAVAGFTVGMQLTVWTWDGKTATPSLAYAYDRLLDDSAPVALSGNVLTVGEKHEFLSFSSCGACEGKQVEHRFRLDSDGVTDLGSVSSAPELAAIDAALTRAINGEPTDALASPQAMAALHRTVMVAKADTVPGETPSLGDYSAPSVQRVVNGATTVCFASDESGPLKFTLKPQGSGFFITAVQPLQSGAKGESPCAGSPN
jgi:hypothetical protein